MSSSPYLSAGIFGTYGPFHCLTPSRSNTTASSTSTSTSTSTHTSTSTSPTSSLSSIRSINHVLFSRRRKSPRRMASTSSVLPLSVAEPNDFLRMNEGIYYNDNDGEECYRDPRSDSLGRRRRRGRREGGVRRAEGDDSPPPEIVGLMEPRPREVVGWGIGEVLDAGML